MANDIKSFLADLISAKGAIGSLKNGIDSLNKMTMDLSLDPKALIELKELQKVLVSQAAATEELNAATEEYNKLQKELSDTSKKSSEEVEKILKQRDEQLEKIADLSKETEKYQRIVVRAGKNVAAAEEEVTRKVLASNEEMINKWKANTLAGKSYNLLSSNIAKATAGVTFATMGMKALGRFTDAARLRNNLMIASYGDLSDNLVQAGISTLKYESAMRGAQATAIYLGMSGEDVSGIMLKYQRIVGKASPEALGALTEATLATAKVMGIDGAQAVAYVSAKMDNFGGTAQSALSSLMELRTETQKYNTSLSGVSIRGDDVVKTIQDITNSNNVYAVDQRFLAQTLMRTSSTLQANGESYNYAQKMANNYTKSLSSEAPEWMKITNSFDISKEVMKGTVKGTDANGKAVTKLTDEMAAKLEKAKPGLSKKVGDLLNAGYSEYDTTRLLGETLGDTEVGMTLMSKKIVDLGKSSITTLASVYGKSYMEAEEMYKAAVRSQELEENTRLLKEGSIKDQEKLKEKMMETLKMSSPELENALKNEESKKRLLELYSDQNSLAKASASIEGQRTDAIQKQAELKKKLVNQEISLAELKKKGASASAIKLAETAVADTKSALDAQTAIVKKGQEDAKVGKEDALKKVAEGVKENQQPTSILTGDYFKSVFEKMSSPLGLLSAASIAFFATSTANQLLQNMFLAKIAAGGSATSAAAGVAKDLIVNGAKTVGGAVSGVGGSLLGTGASALGWLTGGGVAAGAAGLAGAGALGVGLGYGASSLLDYATDGGYGRTVGKGGEWLADKIGPSDAEIFATSGKQEYTGQRNPRKHGTSTTAPSDKTRESLVKTNTDQSVQQAKAVQQAVVQAQDANTPATTTQNTNAPTTTPSGTFGTVNPDGSIMLKVDGFMPAVATAMATAKTGR